MSLKIVPKVLLVSFFVISLASLHAQGEDPYRKGNPKKASQAEDSRTPRLISILIELFSLPIEEGAELLRSGKDDSKVYADLVAGAKLEAVTELQARSGEMIRSEAVTEFIYPTEYDLPQLNSDPKNKKELSPEEEQILKNLSSAEGGLIPTAFEVRNTGLSVEVGPTLGTISPEVIDLALAVDFVKYIGESSYGEGTLKVSMPEFETQRLLTSVTVISNKPTFAGTLNKPPSAKDGGGLSERVWFAMVTGKVKLVK